MNKKRRPTAGGGAPNHRAGQAIDGLIVEQRWHEAAAARHRREAIKGAKALLHDALSIVDELARVSAAGDQSWWELAWELNTTVHCASYPLFKLAEDEREAFFARLRRAS